MSKYSKNSSLLAAVMVMGTIAAAHAAEPQYLVQRESKSTTIDSSSPLVVVSHVDVMPKFTDPSTELLRKYRTNSLKENGVRKMQLLQQVGRPNHYTVVEEWDNQQAYDEHVSARNSREFRASLQPMLGSPYDDRPHHSIE